MAAVNGRNDRRGSFMSDRQIAYAAVAGKKVSFKIIAGAEFAYEVQGYVVGMDDYHWMVAVNRDEGVGTTLVHKGSADVIHIPRDSNLENEPQYVRDDVRSMGQKFWKFCRDTYLRPLKADSEERYS